MSYTLIILLKLFRFKMNSTVQLLVCLCTAGSYVALTVLGRPPGLPQIPLSDGEGEEGPLFSLTIPHSPGPIGPDRSSSSPSPSERKLNPLPVWVRAQIIEKQPWSPSASYHLPSFFHSTVCLLTTVTHHVFFWLSLKHQSSKTATAVTCFHTDSKQKLFLGY